MAKKKRDEVPEEEVLPSMSKLTPGKGSKRKKTRFISIFGVPKTRKTGSCSTLPRGRTKWLVSDSNCVPTLDMLKRLPHDEDLHECSSLQEALMFTNEALDLAEREGADALGIDYLVVDSVTQFNDWHQQEVAKQTNQSYMGETKEGNGWQQFNAEFGKFFDNLARLTSYCTVICIGHIKESAFKKKGQYATLSLPGQMAEKLARLSNWLLYKTFDELLEVPEGTEADDFITVEEEENGTKRYFESVLWTKAVGNILASVNSSDLKTKEPGDLYKMLQKANLA
jgi:hypothetical protein